MIDKKAGIAGLALVMLIVAMSGCTIYPQASLTNPGDNVGVAVASESDFEYSSVTLDISPNRIAFPSRASQSIKIAPAIDQPNIILDDCLEWRLESADITLGVTSSSTPSWNRGIRFTYPVVTPHTAPDGGTYYDSTATLLCQGKAPYIRLTSSSVYGTDDFGQASGTVTLVSTTYVEPTPDPVPEPTPEPTPEPVPEPQPQNIFDMIEQWIIELLRSIGWQ